MNNRPIFIVGTGRTGSTILHTILTHHPQIAWPSRLCNQHPTRLKHNKLVMTCLDIPILRAIARRVASPGEVYNFWDFHYGGFSSPCRDLTSQDVDIRTAKRLNRSFSDICTSKRSRALFKITGWPRIGFLKKVFPDAKFIYLYRDGRAAVYSYLRTSFCDVWKGPNGWSWGALPEAQLEKWHQLDDSFLALAGILWVELTNHFDRSKELVSDDDILEVSYEELCNNPLATLESIAGFCGLSWSIQFAQSVEKFHLQARNNKWQQDLSDEQQSILTKSMEDTLRKYGYI